MVCRAAGDVIDRELSLRLKTSLSERKRYSRRISNLIERAGANLGFLESPAGQPVTPEEAVDMERTFAKIARDAVKQVDEFYA